MFDTQQVFSNIARNLGSTNFNGLCQTFAETVTGSGWLGRSAVDAWDRLKSYGKQDTLDGAGARDLVYFAPHESNRGYGHVGVMVGPDTMVSATDTGVKQYKITDWVKETGQRLLGYVPADKILTTNKTGDVDEGLNSTNTDINLNSGWLPQIAPGKTRVEDAFKDTLDMPNPTVLADQKYLSDTSTDAFSKLDILRRASVGLDSQEQFKAPDESWALDLAKQNEQFTSTMMREIWGSKNATPSGMTFNDEAGARMTGHAMNEMLAHKDNDWAKLTAQVGSKVFGQTLDGDSAAKLTPIFMRQIYQESGFDPAVIFGQRTSSAGAVGIAQIVPRFHPDVNPLDPHSSLEYAAGLMARSYQAYGGNVLKALAAYNAGAGTVQQAVEAGGPDWAQYLPNETKRYITSITGYEIGQRSDSGS